MNVQEHPFQGNVWTFCKASREDYGLVVRLIGRAVDERDRFPS
jgi:hypothetical protein